MKTRTRTWKPLVLLAALGGMVAACDDHEEPAAPAVVRSVTIAEEAIRLVPGGTQDLTVRVTGTGDPIWRVQDPAVATVEPGGTVRGLSPGMTWIAAAADSNEDSVRVTVSFTTAPATAIAFSLGTDEDPLRLSGVSRLYRYLEGDGSFTLVTAAVGAGASPDLHLEDFFADQDTMLMMRLSGTPEPGFRTVESWEVVDLGGGRFRIEGAEGASVWIRDPSDATRAHYYVPVTDMELEIDRAEEPFEVGPPSGRLVGRMSFEAAGLVVEIDEEGMKIVGQVSTETTPIFAEFDLPQRIHPLGLVRTMVAGGPLPLEPAIHRVPQVGVRDGGLLINTAGGTRDGRLYSSQIWAGSFTPGINALGVVRLEELMDGSALAPQRAWAWTGSGTRARLEDGQPLENFGFSTEGTLDITRWEAPGEETWGVLEGTVDVQETLFFGGEPGATQTVAMEIVAPVAPLTQVVYPHRPWVGEGEEETGTWRTRIGNGSIQLPGRVVETSVDAVQDVPVTLTWDGGSATVLTNEEGDFLFTGIQPGSYQLSFELTGGRGLARGQRQVIGPLNLTTDFPMWIPIKLADAEGNGGLRVVAGSAGVNRAVDGVELRVRPAGSSEVIAAWITGDVHVRSGMARGKLPPGRYEVDVTVPPDYRLGDDQASTVSVEVFAGHESNLHVTVLPD